MSSAKEKEEKEAKAKIKKEQEKRELAQALEVCTHVASRVRRDAADSTSCVDFYIPSCLDMQSSVS